LISRLPIAYRGLIRRRRATSSRQSEVSDGKSAIQTGHLKSAIRNPQSAIRNVIISSPRP
jgi:hypothetical protein